MLEAENYWKRPRIQYESLGHIYYNLIQNSGFAQRGYFINCNPGKNPPHLLPTAKMKLLNVLNPKMLISMTFLVGHQRVLVD